ncbi:MAG: bacterial Ig-like domain-containing protein [Bacteroidales bacterium]|nr:bacterial Ig-like domain-containing protein [Bacteroidales bacterium]
MKKIFNSLMVLVAAATAFASCTKEVDTQDNVTPGQKMKTITVKTDIGTRTTLDSNHENIIWSTGDKMSIFNDASNANFEAVYAAGADLTVEVPEATEEIYAHYPYYIGNESGPTSVSIYISNAQTQKNPGELNGYNYPMVAKGTVTADDKALISLYPVASALALNIYHTGLQGTESVLSVKVTPSSNTGFVGSQTTDLTADNITYSAAADSDPITVTLTNALALGSVKPTNPQTFADQIYVCLAKQSYANVTFEILTTKGTYTITSNATAFDCVNNDFVPVNINLARATYKASIDPTSYSWTLVKDALAVGDKVVIAAAGSDVAMSTNQKEHNRDQIGITKSVNSMIANADVQVFEVVSGSKSGTVALKCLNGEQIGKYIAAASSGNNYLHSNVEIDDNASWSINFDSDGSATAVAQGSYSRNTIRYNSGSSLFSCYASGQADIIFYRAGLPNADLSFPGESYTVNIGDTFTAPTLTNPHSVTVNYSSSNTNVAAVDASTGAVTIGTTAGKATITASFSGNESYLADEASYEIIVVDPNAERWVKTAIGDITANDVFVIVGGSYAVTNDNGTDAAPAAVAVQITGDALSDIPAANLQWKLAGSASAGYSFSPANDATKFLFFNSTSSSSNNNNIRVGTGDRKVWEFDNNGIMKTKDTYTVRYFSKYDNKDWRGYVNTSNGAVALEFYVKQGGSSTPTKTLSSISVTPPTKIAYTVGEAFDATGMVVTATYSDATTADVTASVTTDFATQVASAGNKTVTVTYTEETISKTGTFTITVTEPTGGTTVTFVAGTDKGSTTGQEADSMTKNGITISCTSAALGRTDNYRFYTGSTITISTSTGTITRVVFTNAEGYAQTLLSVPSEGVGSYSNGVWTGSATSLTLKPSAQYRATQIAVTYQ